MTPKNRLLKMAIAFIGLTLLILIYMAIKEAVSRHLNMVYLIAILAEGSLLSSFVRLLKEKSK